MKCLQVTNGLFLAQDVICLLNLELVYILLLQDFLPKSTSVPNNIDCKYFPSLLNKNFDNNLSLSIYYASFQLKKKILPLRMFCSRQIDTVNSKTEIKFLNSTEINWSNFYLIKNLAPIFWKSYF